VYVQILNVNMKTKFYQTILIISLVFTYGHICAQNNTTTDFYNQIKNYDLSTIFNPDSILIEDRENNSEKIQRAEILGFIGNNYESDLPTYKQGFVVSDVVLYEDKKQKHSGFFSGTLTSKFIIDNKGTIRYDALMFVADGFSNNGFIGNWTSYKTNEKKPVIGEIISRHANKRYTKLINYNSKANSHVKLVVFHHPLVLSKKTLNIKLLS